jgi:hypothetical protein
LKDELETERAKAATPVAKDWSDFQNLAATLAEADDADDARLRLRTVLRRRFSEIWLRIHAKGAARLVFVQAWFADVPTRHRTFLIYYRPAANQRPLRWEVRSWLDDASLDVRNPAEAKIIARTQERILDDAFTGRLFDVFNDNVGAALTEELLEVWAAPIT